MLSVFQPAAARGVCALVIALAVFPACAAEENWLRHFRVGGMVALNVKAKFKTEGQFPMAGTAAGSPGTGGSHSYDDGYVRPDQGTDPNNTSNWGYNNAGQYNSGAQTLTFHSTKSYTVASGSHDESDALVGLDVAYGADLGRWGNTWYGWELGFGFLPVKITDSRALPGTFTRTVHQYATGGIVVPEPPPYAGGDSGLGPNLPNTATALPDDTIAGTLDGSRTLRASVYSLRFGPTFLWEFGRHFAVYVNGGPAVAWATGEYKYKEDIVTADGGRSQVSDSSDDDKFLFGGSVGATLLVHTVESADIYLGVQFMSLGDMTVGSGGRKAELDLSAGVYFSAGINWPF